MTIAPFHPEPGRYYDGTTSEQYHGSIGLSSTSLRHIARSIDHYHEAKKQPPTLDMIRGSLVHDLVLTPSQVADRYAIRPPFGTKKADKLAAAEWDATHRHLTAVSRRLYSSAQSIASALKRHPAADVFLGDAICERSYYAENPSTELLVKARPDIWLPGLSLTPGSCGTVVDLKVTADATERRWANHAADMGYHVQQALYEDVMELVEGAPVDFIFWVVEAEPPHNANLWRLPRSAVEAGQRTYTDALYRWKAYIQPEKPEDRWTGYPNAIQDIHWPKWAT